MKEHIAFDSHAYYTLMEREDTQPGRTGQLPQLDFPQDRIEQIEEHFNVHVGGAGEQNEARAREPEKMAPG